MSVSNFLKKKSTKYMDCFKKNPEKMAVSYAFILGGYCVAMVDLIMAIREIKRQKNILNNMEFALAKCGAYIEGLCDAYKLDNSCENKNRW